MFGNPHKSIDKALGQFTEIQATLKLAIEACEVEHSQHEVNIKALCEKQDALKVSAARAKAAHEGISKLLGGG